MGKSMDSPEKQNVRKNVRIMSKIVRKLSKAPAPLRRQILDICCLFGQCFDLTTLSNACPGRQLDDWVTRRWATWRPERHSQCPSCPGSCLLAPISRFHTCTGRQRAPKNRKRKSPRFSVVNVPVASQTAVGTLFFSKNREKNCNH